MGSHRLLMLDDDPRIGAFVSHVAEGVGFDFHYIQEAEDFADSYRLIEPDLIILDLIMPNRDGIEIMRFLAGEGCRARILLMSGYDAGLRNSAFLLGEAQNLRMIGVLPKPVRAARLRSLLSELADDDEDDEGGGERIPYPPVGHA